MYSSQFKEYIEDLAAKLPAPGGGSAAALVGALGVALMEMVANFTAGKEKYASVEKDMKELLAFCRQKRSRLLELVDEDVSAYKKLDRAIKEKREPACALPACAPRADKHADRLQAALKEAAAVPLETANICHEAAERLSSLLDKGNRNLVSDAGAAASFLASAFESSVHNVEVNLGYVEDEDFVVEITTALEPQMKEVMAIKDVISAKVRGILASKKKD